MATRKAVLRWLRSGTHERRQCSLPQRLSVLPRLKEKRSNVSPKASRAPHVNRPQEVIASYTKRVKSERLMNPDPMTVF